MVSDDTYYKAGAILLPGVSVLPHNAIPLHIYEERYREMLKDAIASDSKFIIGSLPELDGELENVPLKVAVVVEVVANEQLPDGRSMLVVSARERAEIVSWDRSSNYPRAVYHKMQREDTEGAETIISLLKDKFMDVLTGCSEKEKAMIVEHLDSKESLEAVIDTVAQYSTAEHKRRFFLEEASDSKRASKLLLLLEGE